MTFCSQGSLNSLVSQAAIEERPKEFSDFIDRKRTVSELRAGRAERAERLDAEATVKPAYSCRLGGGPAIFVCLKGLEGLLQRGYGCSYR